MKNDSLVKQLLHCGAQKIPDSKVDYKTALHSPEPTQMFTPHGLKKNARDISFKTIWGTKCTPGEMYYSISAQ